MNISNAMIEITRRCNMSCEHCLRGNAQNKDITKVDIDTFMSKVSSINSLTITGGEPSLKPQLIKYIVASAKKHGVDICDFYIATNAKKISHEFIKTVLDLYLYCDDNEMSTLNWSNDKFHENDPEAVRLLSAFKFASPKYTGEYEFRDSWIIPEGRGADWGGDNYKTDYGFEVDEDMVSEGDVYLNALGEIVSGCDWSYENQSEDHRVCHVTELTIKQLEHYEP